MSFSQRLFLSWPNALEVVEKLPFGTLSLSLSAIVIGTIDYGYLTYYTQGKFIFIFAVIILFLSLIFKIFTKSKVKSLSWIRLFTFFIGVYVSV